MGLEECRNMETHDTTSALYVVATPLGNLDDITLRAVALLRAADLIACEDTRHSRHLLDRHGIRAPLLPLHEHNENAAAEKLVAALGAGKRVALVSDAGTPGISDPGARAIAAVRAAGHRVVPLPGPNAAIAALSAAGLPDARFLFAGFLPTKAAARRADIARLAAVPGALVFYEAPHRVAETVADLVAALEPQRTLVVARELTKLFEEIAAMPLADAPAWFAADANRARGEFVLIVSGPPPRLGIDAEAERVLALLLAELPVKQAAKLAAAIAGASKNELYQRALELKAV
ncbi:MAG: 16S rRNA (cytidine(1402)-2'-O)-methyltransferase [Rhodocyclales bacterium]|nr:16S rRNA (cytidine(1402)-2'-O)-methyltransferase [Rhodocyclales bacterium]